MTKLPLTARALVALALAAALTGCSKSPSSPTSSGNTDQTLVQTGIASSPELVDDDLMFASGQTQAFGAAPAGSDAAIHPRFFWRTLRRLDRSFGFAFGDTDSTGRPRLALVTVVNHALGTFNIIPSLPGDSTVADTANVIHKPLDDTWLRHFVLYRVTSADSMHTEWHVVAASGASVTSSGATTTITSVRIQATGVDTTLADPLHLYYLAHALHFAAGDSVMVTATTPRTDDVLLFYWHDHRERFHNNGDGTYGFTLHIGDADTGYRWIGVNALSHGTLYDDALPYDSKAWLLHCFVGPPPTGPYYE